MAERMWAKGVRFFVPPEQVVYHLWSRQGRPVFTEQKQTKELGEDRRRSLALVRDQLGIGTFGANCEYGHFSGIDFSAQRVLRRGSLGGLSEVEALRCFCDAENLANSKDGIEGSAGTTKTAEVLAPTDKAGIAIAAGSKLPPNLMAKILGMM